MRMLVTETIRVHVDHREIPQVVTEILCQAVRETIWVVVIVNRVTGEEKAEVMVVMAA